VSKNKLVIRKLEYHLEQFKPGEAKQDRVWLIIAPRGSGKSVQLKDLLYKTRTHYDFGLAMTATAETVKTFKEFLPPAMIYTDGYDFDVAEKFVNLSKTTADSGKERHSVLIMDDCMFDQKVMKTKTQQALHLNGRHYHSALFNTTQYAMIIPPVIRSNVDYVLCLQDLKQSNRKRLYEMFYGVFPSFREFNSVFQNVTRDYGALVLDCTTSSGRLEDCVKWYRASLETPPFRLGKRVFWRLNAFLTSKINEANNNENDEKKIKVPIH
jgi:hypothetical protein